MMVIDYETTRQGVEYQRLRKLVLAEETLCWLCGNPATEDDPFSVDHVRPWSRGGPNKRWNLRVAHLSCNQRRGNTSVHRCALLPPEVPVEDWERVECEDLGDWLRNTTKIPHVLWATSPEDLSQTLPRCLDCKMTVSNGPRCASCAGKEFSRSRQGLA